MQNKKRAWLLAGSIILVGVIISTVLSRQKEPMRRMPGNGGMKPVEVVTVRNGDIPLEIVMTGPLYAYDKVELYAEVSGVLQETPRRFKEGVRYEAGDTLIKIDDRVYNNNVLAQKGSLLNQITLLLPDLSIDFPQSGREWEDYLNAFDLEKPLKPLPEPASDQERYYIASRNIYNQYYAVKAMEETLFKYTLRAPFDGVVTEANMNPGTLVRVGQRIGVFTNTGLLEMEAAVGVREVDRLTVGQRVVLASEVVRGTFEGRIQRINPVIDPNSMTVKVFIHTKDPNLTDGMYITARVDAKPFRNAFAVKKDLILDGDRLYTVADSVLVSRSVTVIAEEGDRVIVRGLSDGQRILGEAWAEAREGARLPVAGPGPGQMRPNETAGSKDALNTQNKGGREASR